MAIGKTRSNVRALIEDYYDILSQMITDIAYHYQKEEDNLVKEIEDITKEIPDEDYEEKFIIEREFDDISDRKHQILLESRRLLFCYIFYYLEMMLRQITIFYNIKVGNTNQIKQIVDKIYNDFYNRYEENIKTPQRIESLIDFYRLLRIFFVHGILYKTDDMNSLALYVKNEELVNSGIENEYEIIDNKFLQGALDNVRDFLFSIEDAYNAKSKHNL